MSPAGLRRSGRVPGNVYGSGGDALLFSVKADELTPIINSGQHVLEMDLDGSTELTMFREVQWDTFGTAIQHIDLLRVDRDQRVVVDVPIELRGIAPGTHSGGILDQQMRSMSVECPAFAIPESVAVRVGSLEIGDSIRVADVELDEGQVVQNEPELIVVQVNEAVEEVEDEEAAAGPVEPEVIGRSKDDSEDEA